MGIKIVADSCCDLSAEMRQRMNIETVPLTIQIGDREYRDDEKLDVKEMVRDMRQCETAPKTACPTPGDFLKAYEGPESVFVVTLSSALSGTYNSAMLAKKMFLEEVDNKFIHVFDSLSATIAETLISLKIFELANLQHDHNQIVEKVNDYIQSMKTLFLLESLENLIKAGRINKLKGRIANLLNIKPIMGADDDGTIKLVEDVRGYKKAFKRFVEIIGEQGEKLEEKVIGIAHCNCLERAEAFKAELLKHYRFKDIIIVDMAGLSSVYTNEGGIVVAF